MSKRLKNVLYWCSVVLPLYDVFIGIVKGFVKGYYDAKLQALREWDLEQQKAFRDSFKD